MQAERRAFWILRTVPVPLGKLFAAKARAWSVVVGGAAAFAFLPLAMVMPPAPLASVVAAGLLVVGGAVSMTFLAIAMAAGGADLSDEQTTAVGPATIYASSIATRSSATACASCASSRPTPSAACGSCST